MTDYGITPEGFTVKPLSVILEEINTQQRADISQVLDLEPETLQGQMNGIFSSHAAELWEVLGGVYKAFDRDQAEDDALDTLGGLLGIERPADEPSRVTLSLSLNAGVTVPEDSLVSIDTRPDVVFRTVEAVSSGGSPGDFPVDALCTVNGPTVALAGQIDVIVTPVTGWTSVTNHRDADLGRLRADNTEYRRLIEAGEAAQGGSTTDAIRADVLQLNSVLEGSPIRDAFVFENTKWFWSNGLPPKSIEVLVYDNRDTDNDQLIAQAVYKKAAGIETYGSISVVITLNDGSQREIKFSRPVAVSIWIEMTVTVTDDFPVDGDEQIKIAEIALGETLNNPGSKIIALAMRAEALKVSGVLDVPIFKIGFAENPTQGVNLILGRRSVPDYDSSRIAVTVLAEGDL